MAFRDDLDAHATRRKLDDDEVRLLSAFVQAEHARKQRVHATWLVAAIAAVVLMVAAWPGRAGAARPRVEPRISDRDADIDIIVQQRCIRRALRAYHDRAENEAMGQFRMVGTYDPTPDIEQCLTPPR
jgi:hypothetical protein